MSIYFFSSYIFLFYLYHYKRRIKISFALYIYIFLNIVSIKSLKKNKYAINNHDILYFHLLKMNNSKIFNQNKEEKFYKREMKINYF
jgi:hypothetical protein